VGEAMEGDGGFGHGGAVKVGNVGTGSIGRGGRGGNKGTAGEAKTVHLILAL